MTVTRYPDKNKKTILVVDDSAIERQRAVEIFSEQFNVLEAQNGREALGVVKSNYGLVAHYSSGNEKFLPSEYSEIQLIILDLVMPVMDGHAFLNAIKQEEILKDIPVIVATTLTTDETLEQCLKEGAIEFINKPYNEAIILARVNNIIGFKENVTALSLLKYDALTGFRNRYEYYKDITKIERSDELNEKPMGIVFSDINGLKRENDNKGHIAGDNLIKKIAHNIKVVFGDEYTYRMGGDEFVTFSFDESEEIFNKKIEVLNELWTKDVSASVGSIWLDKASNIEHYISLADKKMYLNKNAHYGKSGYASKNPADLLKNYLEYGDLLPGGFVIFHTVGEREIIYINNDLLDMLGFDSFSDCSNTCKNSFEHLIPAEEVDKIVGDIRYQMGNGNNTAYVEHNMICKDGSTKKVSNYVRFVHMEKYGDICLSFINDIQREFDYGEINLYKILDDARNEAVVASEAKSQFLYNMSHDIRTLMNSVVGYTHLSLKEEKSHAEILEYLKKMEFAETNLMSLISNILELSTIESNRLIINNTPMCIDPAIDKIKIFVGEQCKARDITLNTYLDVKTKYFYQDQDKNGEITINIINNAIKYTPRGGTISFGLRELPGENLDEIIIEFTCSDTGIGMSKEFLDHAFDSFERERSLKSTWQGSGLGLGIVKKLVELMGGRVEIISELGKGTTVKTYTPHRICTKAVYDEFMKTQRYDDVDITGKRILVVDDNDLNLDITTEILSDNGVIAEQAHDGKEACQLLLMKDPSYYDAVLMDIQMPVMDGLEATKLIRNFENSKLANIPIVAVTAHAMDSNEEVALKAGMNAYISKPIIVDQMLAVLGKVILH